MLTTNKVSDFISRLTFKSIFFFGLIIVIGVTFNELIRDKHLNYTIFRNATILFWDGVHPFGNNWWSIGMQDYFLYPPLFNILFAPFAFLPVSIGAFLWNITNYSLLCLAIYNLPYIKEKAKSYILLYSIPIIATSVMSFQYNLVVTYIFLFAYILLEKEKMFYAILLILISSFTKVYGIMELCLLLFYPKLFKNIVYIILISAVLFFIPLIKLPFAEFFPYYNEWMIAVIDHAKAEMRIFESFFNMHLFFGNKIPSYIHYIQIAIILCLSIIAFIKIDFWNKPKFRLAALSIIMIFCPLFGNSTEKHTYIIAIVGFLYWYYSLEKPDKITKILYWANFIVLVIMPVDLLFPPKIMRYLFNQLDLNQWVILITWITMVYKICVLKAQAELEACKV